MPHSTTAISPNGFASLQRLNVNLHIQEAVYQFRFGMAVSAADDAAAHGQPITTLVAELTAVFDRTVA